MKKQLLIALLALTSYSSMQASALFIAGEKAAIVALNGIMAGLATYTGYEMKKTTDRITKIVRERVELEQQLADFAAELEQQMATYASTRRPSIFIPTEKIITFNNRLNHPTFADLTPQDFSSCFVYGMGLAALGIMVVESDAIKASMESAGKAVDAAKEAIPQAVRLIGQTLPTTNTPRISKSQAYPTYTNAYAGKPLEATIYTNDAVTI